MQIAGEPVRTSDSAGLGRSRGPDVSNRLPGIPRERTLNDKGLGLFPEGIQYSPPALPLIPNELRVIERELAPGTVLRRPWVCPGEVHYLRNPVR